MRFILFLILLATPSAIIKAQSADSAIRKLLQTQITAWNEGDIPRFMKTYWKSDSLVFVGSNGPTYGWQHTLERYQQSYPDTASMGKLAFEILEIRPLAKELYFIIGKWALTRSVGNVSGTYTLLIRRIKGEWKIIADHSS